MLVERMINDYNLPTVRALVFKKAHFKNLLLIWLFFIIFKFDLPELSFLGDNFFHNFDVRHAPNPYCLDIRPSCQEHVIKGNNVIKIKLNVLQCEQNLVNSICFY